MKKLFVLLLVIFLLGAGGAYVRSASNPCNRTLSYSIGTYDARFGITQDRFRQAIEEAEKVWEVPMSRDLFRYDPAAEFKVNLVFDDRQKKTIDEREFRQQIDLTEESYEKLVAQHNALEFQYQQDLSAYEQDHQAYEQRLEQYNSDVTYWNSRGGAPAEDFKRLNTEKQSLNAEGRALENEQNNLSVRAEELNTLTDKVNDLAKSLNKDVDAYNGRFGTARRFDQGTYTGDSINIFQFNDESDLGLVLAHELGHALKLEHVEGDPKAIMYYLMDQQELSRINLTDTDLGALRSKCGID